jgi:uncharacterized membrane protein
MCDVAHSPWLTLGLVLASLALFAICFQSARLTLGTPAAWSMLFIASSIGWFAEQMGSSKGWFFGSYCYTSVLGWRLGDVPMVIALMWFGLMWIGLVMASLILWRSPWKQHTQWSSLALTVWLAAMIITAFDLGADPYFVFEAKAWIMQKTDGGWFGETLQGFVGWMGVSFFIGCLVLWRVKPTGVNTQPVKLHSAVLWPILAYGSGMVFQMIVGKPIEIRAIAFFAMGIPLVAALAAWWSWKNGECIVAAGAADPQRWPLQTMTQQADPLADDMAQSIMGSDITQQLSTQALARLVAVNRSMATWGSNGSLATAAQSCADASLAKILQSYVDAGRVLPTWADAAKVERAEQLFIQYGPLSCTLLFCASLPHCYVAPHLAKTLHIAGQLEAHTENRIRRTAAMIFPVMMRGGLMSSAGFGIAQVLKVRLVHATIRHLILHGHPSEAQVRIGSGSPPAGVPAMYAALYAHGWDTRDGGLPCSQFELAYTLLTFSYVFLNGLRTLGIAWKSEDEEAYLHVWNVMGHVLGVRPELMAHTMSEAAELFTQMQSFATSQPPQPDPRPQLGQALMSAMGNAIKIPLLRTLPAPFTRWLIGAHAAGAIGVRPASLLTRLVFILFRGFAAAIDGLGRLFQPQFSLSSLLTRVLGYHFVTHFLLDQTRPIQLPSELLEPVSQLIDSWSEDQHAPKWVNLVENYYTRQGSWSASR